MTGVIVFHHAQGRTAGMIDFVERLRAAGHAVEAPDLYDGETFDDLEAGVGHAERIGFASIVERGVAAVQDHPSALVYIGFSLGVLPAQRLAQTRDGALGAILIGACVPPASFDTPWPTAVPLQVHGMASDPFFADEGDLDCARELVNGHDNRQLFIYPGDRHLFADASLPDHEPAAAELLTTRLLSFLGAIDAGETVGDGQTQANDSGVG